MTAATKTDRRTEDRPLKEPRVGGSVWPKQFCPAFTPRRAAMEGDRECWYCQYADFHLKELVPLDVGICCWPKKQID